MATFKTLKVSPYISFSDNKSSQDETYWSAFNFPTTVKEHGPVTRIDFPSTENDKFAISSSTSVKIYSCVIREPIKSFSKFRETAYGATFRKDGKLLAVGGEEGKVRLFDVESKSILREFPGTHSAIHLTRFTTDGLRVLSFGDNKSIVVWDVPGETPLHTFQEHKDYVRSGAVCKSSNDILISGSYDHTVKMFDVRTTKSILTADHGAPVEDVLLFPSGGIFISCGGEMLKVWDVCAGGKLLASVSSHHKSITCLSFASQYKKILSGSLDRHVKVYDVNTYQVCHTMDFPSPILSLGVSGNDDTIAVGMTSGLLSIQNRKVDLLNEENGQTAEDTKPKSDVQGFQNIRVPSKAKRKEMPYDGFLRKFQVSKALDYVLRHHVNKNPEVAMSLIQELMRRGSLRAAVAERHDKELDIMLVFIFKYIDHPTFCRLMIDFTNLVLDVYGPAILENVRMVDLVKRINIKMSRQLQSMTQMMAINGIIETLISTSKTSNDVLDNEIDVLP